MECAGLIGLSVVSVHEYGGSCYSLAIAVGRDIFRPDANALVELLMRIQSERPLCCIACRKLTTIYLQIARLILGILN